MVVIKADNSGKIGYKGVGLPSSVTGKGSEETPESSHELGQTEQEIIG